MVLARAKVMALQTVSFPGAAVEPVALDLLCVAPHPDDAEMGVGGVLALCARAGARVGVLDLTRGELASNGTPQERLREGAEAAATLGLTWRGQLGLPDRGLHGAAAIVELVGALRRTRPALVLIPHAEDPHPDHGAAGHLTREAVFSAGLRRAAGPEWAAGAAATRPRGVLQYCINGWTLPAIAIDVTAVYEVKRRALRAHASQFGPADVPTRLNTGQALAQVEARDRYLGASVGAAFAEGLLPVGPLRLDVAALLGVCRG